MTDLRSGLDEKIQKNSVVLFMKGVPKFPLCGFSAQVVNILEHLEIAYVSVDVLEDQAVREEMKRYSDWPTFPQLYVNGAFIGGCDVVCQMFQTGELQEILTEAGVLGAP